MAKGLISSATEKICTKFKTKAQELYEKASPAVQKQIETIASTKINDIKPALISMGTLLTVGFVIFKALNSSADSPKPGFGTYYEIHITNNYYNKED